MQRMWERTGKDWKSLHLPRPANHVSLAVQTQSQALLPVPQGICPLQLPKTDVPKEQDVTVPPDFSSGKMRTVERTLGVARGQCFMLTVLLINLRGFQGRGVLHQDCECWPCRAGSCAAGTWRGSLLPGAAPGIAHLPACTRVALTKG